MGGRAFSADRSTVLGGAEKNCFVLVQSHCFAAKVFSGSLR